MQKKIVQFILFSVGALLVLPGVGASAEPTKVAAFFDAESREHFELFQKHDGSFFCLVQHANGVLSRFHVRPEEDPDATGMDAAPSQFDLRGIVERNRKRCTIEDMRTFPWTSGRNPEGMRTYPNRAPCENPCASRDQPGREKSLGLILLLLISGQGES